MTSILENYEQHANTPVDYIIRQFTYKKDVSFI